ncbi:hypothetical protein VTK73DRAFT_6138 [Phialemonium thermophilum]|uniref:Uncharacterized protein n=1 Tax=Phialemonium thermophilum TaxID=223376 RepID=A0ABR3WKH1_9PEZI
MASAAEFRMPGAYHFDGVASSSRPVLNASLFKPPASPPSASSSVYNLVKSNGSLLSDVSLANTPSWTGAKRKRGRSGLATDSTPVVELSAEACNALGPQEEDHLQTGLGEVRYTLAGQIDTPEGAVPAAGDDNMDESTYSDIDYRRALGSKRPRDDNLDSPALHLSNFHITAGAGASPSSGGWSAVALNTIGEVVGKVWEFCKSGAFRGFHAGGGRGYELGKTTTLSTDKDGQKDRLWPNLQDDSPTAPPMPGYFPQSDYMPYIPDYHDMSTPETTPRPAAKRRHISESKDELRRNWVIVDEPSLGSESDLKKRGPTVADKAQLHHVESPRSQHPRFSGPTAASSGRRSTAGHNRLAAGAGTPSTARRGASLRISHAGSPTLHARSPASFASPRSPVAFSSFSPSSGSRIPVASHHHPVGGNPFAAAAATTRTVSRPSRRQASAISRAVGQSPSARSSSPAKLARRTTMTTVTASAAASHHIGAINSGAARSSHRRHHSSASAASMSNSPMPRRTSPSGGGGQASTTQWYDPGDIDASPRLDAEAKRLAQRQLAAERAADARMEALNKQLMDMIRQGREALGTTVEVEMDSVGDWEEEEED